MEKRTPIQKSILRHGLKEIDKKWAHRKVAMPEKSTKQRAINKMKKS